MARTQIRALNLKDFTGGLNLSTDTVRLADNESPDLLNVDIDRRGGFQVRRGIAPYSTDALADDPKTIWNYTTSLGTSYTMAQVTNKIYRSTGTTWTQVGTDLAVSGDAVCPVVFNGVTYWARGDNNVAKWDGSTATTMNTAFNDTTTPSSGNVPRAKHMAVHAGYMWIAGTYESGTHYPNRIRWSWANTFNNSGENWRSDEYIDIDEGKDGDYITALVPFGDQLIIFKRDSMYSLYGYSSETFVVNNVSNTVGAVSHEAAVATPAGLFFFDHQTGVNVFGGKNVNWVFEQIWPALRDGSIPSADIDNVMLGWVYNRLWVSVPWVDEPALDRGMTFVFDPYVRQGGAWTKYDLPCGPFGRTHRTQEYLSSILGTDRIFRVDVQDQYYDNYGVGNQTVINAYYRTKWIDLDQPAIKKRWKRMEAVMQAEYDYNLPVVTYKDYDVSATVKSFVLNARGASQVNALSGIWDDPASEWDEVVWAQTQQVGTVDRGSNLGVSRAVSLKVGGEVVSIPTDLAPSAPVFWAVDSLIIKFIPRRLR